MVYISQDIAHNIYNASKSGDTKLSRDIISDEIAKLIVTTPYAVKKAIIDANISIGANPSNKEIAKALNANISINSKLRKNITSLILHTNKIPSEMNFEGYMPKPNGKKVNEKAIKADRFVYDSMYFAFNSDSETDSDESEKDLVNKIKTHENNFNVINGKEKKNYKKAILYTALIAVGLTVGGYFLTRYLIKRHKAKYADGGEIADSSVSTEGGVDELGLPISSTPTPAPTQPAVAPMPNSNIVTAPNGDIYDKSYLPK